MIRHIVMLRLVDGYDPVELIAVMSGLAALDLPGFIGFEHGPNRDLEQKAPDYLYGFVCSFSDEAAVKTYAADPGHQALGARLVDLCGGGDGIMVMDLDV
jgi:hypothetical protein